MYGIFWGHSASAPPVTPSGYVVIDRTTSTKYDMYIKDGQFVYASTTAAASAEPIMEDRINAGIYWKLFIDDGQFGIETTLTVQDDTITLTDTVTADDYILFVDDGQFGWELAPVGGALVPRLTLLGVG